MPYLSLAGVNYAYSRRDFDLFLEVVRPHLRLAPDMASLRKSISPDEIRQPIGKEEVKKLLLESAAKKKQPAPVPAAGIGGRLPLIFLAGSPIFCKTEKGRDRETGSGMNYVREKPFE